MSRAREIADRDLAATELILDADNDTSITADTDDQIDIRIAGADDFQFTANTFTAASGSSIATNTISETTSGSGVTIDSVLLKDGDLQTGVNRYVDIRDADGHVSGRLRNVSGSNNALTIEADPDNSASGSYVSFKVDTSEKMKVDDTGDVTISDGDLVIGTSGHGIDFSATADGSSAGFSELFDDYEEGVYSPTITVGSSGTITLNGSYNNGYYTKVGRLVHVAADLRISSVSSPNGTTYISLPFTALNDSKAVSSNAIMTVGITEQTNQRGPFFVRSLSNTTTAEVFYDTSASLFTLQSQNAGFGSSDQISFTLTYMTE